MKGLAHMHYLFKSTETILNFVQIQILAGKDKHSSWSCSAVRDSA